MGAPASVMRFTLAKGKPAFDMSCSVNCWSTSRDLGPITERTAWDEVTSISLRIEPFGNGA